MESSRGASSEQTFNISLCYKNESVSIQKGTFEEAKQAAVERFRLGKKKFVLLNTRYEELGDADAFGRLKASSMVFVKVDNEEIGIVETVEDSTPDPSLLRDMGNMNYTVVSALGEVVDNSIQALKQQPKKDVAIVLSEQRLVMKDNGKGMDEGTLTSDWARLGRGDFVSTSKAKQHRVINSSDIKSASIFRDYRLLVRDADNVLQVRRPLESENDFASMFLSFSLGRYGVGVKYALARLGEAIECRSKMADQAVLSSVLMDRTVDEGWSHRRRSVPAEPRSIPEHFTEVTVEKLRADIAELAKDLDGITQKIAVNLQRIYYYYIKGPKAFLNKLAVALHATAASPAPSAIGRAKPGSKPSSPAAGRGRGRPTGPTPSAEDLKLKHDQRQKAAREHKARMFTPLNVTVNAVSLADLKDTVEDQFLASAADWFPLTMHFNVNGFDDPIQVVGGLSYHPFVKGAEAMPDDDDPDMVLNPAGAVGAKRKRAAVSYIWMGRWMLKTSPDILPFMDPKQNRYLEDGAIPPRCFDRVHGVLFFTRDFEVMQNKIAFLTDKALWQRLQQLCQEDKIKSQYSEWMLECHKRLDQEIKFLGEFRHDPNLNRTIYDEIQNVDKRFAKGDHVTFKRNKEVVFATISYFFYNGKPGIPRDPQMAIRVPTPTGEREEMLPLGGQAASVLRPICVAFVSYQSPERSFGHNRDMYVM
eukprot:TRINITY_DN10770_c0_g1_i1.p1 TRINITY_DN10770_c0_g1~~TRINITY_DN10770_c0_g1_i1.p1  ORF type:complete len:702 (-),score=229.03 TRINITY_DN10770_c0_g1_i1:416-2521(-)